MKIAVVGTGYVGLVSGTCLAAWGHTVCCVDRDERKIADLSAGRIPIYEPGLSELVGSATAAGRLSFTSRLSDAIRGAAAIFIAVGTPADNDGDADLSFVYAATREAAVLMDDDTVLVVKSTVPVGTGDAVERMVRASRPTLACSVASNPEFLREGSAIHDFLHPDRVLVGANDDRARAVLREIYASIADRAPIVVTSRRTAELTKYAANSFLATKITFINEMADLCEQIGADVADLALGMGLDHRIGQAFLNPGPGYGGSCFPKDTQALLRSAQNAGVHLRVVEETIAANEARKRSMALRVIRAAGGSVDGATVAVLGLAFKANTDDVRDSPAVPLIAALQRRGATIRAYDPAAMENAAGNTSGVNFCHDPYLCATGADVVLVLTEWDEFRGLDLHRLRKVMSGDALVDLRNIISADAAKASGLRLSRIGRVAQPTARQGVAPLRSIAKPALAVERGPKTARASSSRVRLREVPLNSTRVSDGVNDEPLL